MTTAQVGETSVTVNNNGPIQDCSPGRSNSTYTFEMIPGFKPFTVKMNINGTYISVLKRKWKKTFQHKSGQYPVWMTRKPRKGDEGVKNPKTFLGKAAHGPRRSLHLRRLFGKSVSIYPRSAPEAERIVSSLPGSWGEQVWFCLSRYRTNKITFEHCIIIYFSLLSSNSLYSVDVIFRQAKGRR